MPNWYNEICGDKFPGERKKNVLKTTAYKLRNTNIVYKTSYTRRHKFDFESSMSKYKLQKSVQENHVVREKFLKKFREFYILLKKEALYTKYFGSESQLTSYCSAIHKTIALWILLSLPVQTPTTEYTYKLILHSNSRPSQCLSCYL